jgi:hypothetical protein
LVFNLDIFFGDIMKTTELAEKKANKATRNRIHEINHWDKEQMFDDNLFINEQSRKDKDSSRIR